MEVIQNYKIQCGPPIIYYIPNFITKEEEKYLINKVYDAPKPKWTYLSNRKLQDYGGVPHKNGMIVEAIPTWLQTFTDRVSQLKIFGDKTANHVLINEYLPGQGIMPHFDGPLFYPTISTISCGSHTVLEFCDADRQIKCKLLLEPCSVVILKDDMYTTYLHSIKEVMEDIIDSDCINLNSCGDKYSIGQEMKRGTRISLTIRNVPKVCKLKLWNL